MTAEDWHMTQNEDYLVLQKARLDEPVLNWCLQFIDLINSSIQTFDGVVRINDYGCAAGHFVRALPNLKMENSYLGIDISNTYLDIARSAFPEMEFLQRDLVDLESNPIVPGSDIGIMSATLEHVDKYEVALSSMLARTSKLFLLRTFTGIENKLEWCGKIGSQSSYMIRQFTKDELVRIGEDAGFRVEALTDSATGGKSKTVCDGRIVRSQTVLLFRRIE